MTSPPEGPKQVTVIRETLVFISYGWADGLEFAERLAKDLEERGGCTVWIDRSAIEKGGIWEIRIEQAIRNSSMVVAVLTRHALREESVCRDEVAFALNEGKRVIPLRVQADPDLKPSLLLTRRNWLDFTGNYETAFAALLQCLSGDQSGLLPPPVPVVAGLVPFDFGPELARHLCDFSGREWIGSMLDAWIANPHGRMLVVTGEPGIGKSAIAAWLSQVRHEQVAAIHFCTPHNDRTTNPAEFIASLVAQLSSQLDGYLAVVEQRHPESTRATANDAFRELIVEPIRMLPARPLALVIVDGLDEACAPDARHDIVEILGNQAEDLPAWLRIVATSRPDQRVLGRLRNLDCWELAASDQANVDDLSRYIAARLQAAPFDAAERAVDVRKIADRLMHLAQGNFMYARKTLDALADGTLAPDDLGRLASGLSGYFTGLFGRLFAEIDYEREVQPLIRALIAAPEPLTFAALKAATGSSPEWLHRSLRRLTALLEVSHDGEEAAYSLFHRALTDWLTDKESAGIYWCDVELGHAALAESCWKEYADGVPAMSPYAARHLAAHLAGAGQWDRLIKAVDDGKLGLLTRWTEQGGHAEGLRLLPAMIAHLRRTGRSPDLAACLMTQIARLHTQLGEYPEARTWLQQALRNATWWRGRRARAIAWHELGSLSMYEGDLPAAKHCFTRALRVCMLGVPVLRDEAASNLLGLATLARRMNRYSEAHRLAQRALRMAQKAGDIYHLIGAHRMLAISWNEQSCHELAVRHLAEADYAADVIQANRELVRNHEVHGWFCFEGALLDGESQEKAEAWFQRAIVETEAIGLPSCAVNARIGLAYCALAQGQTDAARACHEEARRVFSARRNENHAMRLALVQAGIDLQSGSLDSAKARYQQIAEVCRQHGIASEGAVAWSGVGAALWRMHQAVPAEEAWEQAVALAKRCSTARYQLIETGIERLRRDARSVPY